MQEVKIIQCWRPSIFIQLCFVLHIVALGIWIIFPAYWIGVLVSIISLHGLIAIAGLLPKSNLLGSNLSRLPSDAIQRGEIAITIDDGPDPDVTPQILDILRQYNATATFFCIGERAAHHPDLCRAIIASGHSIENHGLRHHKYTSLFGPGGWRREVIDAQKLLLSITGIPPHFFRPIAGLRNPFLDPLLQREQLQLTSWTRRGYDTRINDANLVYKKMVRHLAAGDILLLHDGNAARSPEGKPVVIDVLPCLLHEIARRDLKTVTLRHACKMI